jgi:hypothetical protein
MKHALKVLFYLKKNEAKEDGMCPLMGRITVGKTVLIILNCVYSFVNLFQD